MSRLILLTCSFSPDYAQREKLYERLQSKRFTYRSLSLQAPRREKCSSRCEFGGFCRALTFCLRSMSGHDEPETPPPQSTQSVSWVLNGGRCRAFPMRRLHSAQALSLGKAVSTE